MILFQYILYKNTTPLTNIWGVFTIDDSLDNNPLQIFNYKTTTDIATISDLQESLRSVSSV